MVRKNFLGGVRRKPDRQTLADSNRRFAAFETNRRHDWLIVRLAKGRNGEAYPKMNMNAGSRNGGLFSCGDLGKRGECGERNVYLKLSVMAWWSRVEYKTHSEYPGCESVLLQSKVRTWYLHFSEELEVEVESVEKPKIYFSGKVYCRGKTDMITAFFWRIRGRRG